MNDKTPSERASQPRRKPDGPPPIKPVKKKIGEGDDNLRRREEWYQRRTGARRSPPAT